MPSGGYPFIDFDNVQSRFAAHLRRATTPDYEGGLVVFEYHGTTPAIYIGIDQLRPTDNDSEAEDGQNAVVRGGERRPVQLTLGADLYKDYGLEPADIRHVAAVNDLTVDDAIGGTLPAVRDGVQRCVSAAFDNPVVSRFVPVQVEGRNVVFGAVCQPAPGVGWFGDDVRVRSVVAPLPSDA